MGNGVPLGRISGVQIVADLSQLIIFVLIAFTLAAGVFPAWHPQWSGGVLYRGRGRGAAVLRTGVAA